MDVNRLWQNFADTVTNHYFDLTGRVGRAQFWYYVLVEVVIAIGLAIVQSVLWSGLLTSLFGLAMLLPNLGMVIRRMQDSAGGGRYTWVAWVAFISSGIMELLSFIAALGGIFGAVGFLVVFFTVGWLVSLGALVSGLACLYFCIQPTEAAANAYGAPPPAFDPRAAAAA